MNIVQQFCKTCGVSHSVDLDNKHCSECERDVPPEEMHGDGVCDACDANLYPDG